jgi:hypothetical protein
MDKAKISTDSFSGPPGIVLFSCQPHHFSGFENANFAKGLAIFDLNNWFAFFCRVHILYSQNTYFYE